MQKPPMESPKKTYLKPLLGIIGLLLFVGILYIISVPLANDTTDVAATNFSDSTSSDEPVEEESAIHEDDEQVVDYSEDYTKSTSTNPLNPDTTTEYSVEEQASIDRAFERLETLEVRQGIEKAHIESVEIRYDICYANIVYDSSDPFGGTVRFFYEGINDTVESFLSREVGLDIDDAESHSVSPVNNAVLIVYEYQGSYNRAYYLPENETSTEQLYLGELNNKDN